MGCTSSESQLMQASKKCVALWGSGGMNVIPGQFTAEQRKANLQGVFGKSSTFTNTLWKASQNSKSVSFTDGDVDRQCQWIDYFSAEFNWGTDHMGNDLKQVWTSGVDKDGKETHTECHMTGTFNGIRNGESCKDAKMSIRFTSMDGEGKLNNFSWHCDDKMQAEFDRCMTVAADWKPAAPAAGDAAAPA